MNVDKTDLKLYNMKEILLRRKQMGLFGNKKKEIKQTEQERLDEDLRDDLSKAYDELTSGGAREERPEDDVNNTEETPATDNASLAEDYSAEQFKSKLKAFSENKTDELFREILMALPGRVFNLPSVSNVKEPLENVKGEVRLKKGATLNPALLTAQNKKTYIPIFTDEKSMVQKSPSGVILKFKFDQCLGIVYNKNNPVSGIVINPFTENFILGEELLKKVFKQIDKNGNEMQ